MIREFWSTAGNNCRYCPLRTGETGPRSVEGALNTLLHSLSHSAFDFPSVLLCDLERGVPPCIERPMSVCENHSSTDRKQISIQSE